MCDLFDHAPQTAGATEVNDLPDRLREASHFALMDAARSLVLEAADEIERLRAQQDVDGQSIGMLLEECQDLQDRCVNGEPTGEWLSVAEHPPTEPGRYVAWDGIGMWYYCDFNGEFLTAPGAPPVTHWMPDTPLSIDMRLQALPDRLASEVRKELRTTRWRAKVQSNIISRLKAALERR
jgi:hypothetical protein